MDKVRAPFPWFGGKSRCADIVWRAFGRDLPNYVEPFAGSLAVLLGRPDEARIETVNDKDCVGPQTRMLRSDLTWCDAGAVRVGDRLLGFDENNGPARGGLRAPTRYRRFAVSTVTAVRRLVKRSYRLGFSDGTQVVASANHLWLGGSHASGGRGWRWLKTENMVCNRKTQRSWVLKVCDVVHREESFDAGWLSGMFDGEGSLVVGPGLKASLAQNTGPVLDRVAHLLASRGVSAEVRGERRCKHLEVVGGKHEQLALLMRFQPSRLVRKFEAECGEVSLYGRDHRAVALVSKEYIGETEVVAIETDTHTFIAEGLASHNCYLANFWRAVQHDPEAVAAHADWPVNEADLHARHLWLVKQTAFRERMLTDPDFFDAKVAGWWVWGISQWIGAGWCALPKGPAAKTSGGRKLPLIGGTRGAGVHKRSLSRQLPCISGERGATGRGIHASGSRAWTVYHWMAALQERLRRTRVCCGDWQRILGPSPTTCIGVTGVFLDPPYSAAAGRSVDLYAQDDLEVANRVREWAIANGADPKLRIALCGYEGEHAMPADWTCVAWQAAGGYGSVENAKRERIWFSPHCLDPRKQLNLFGED